MEFVVEFGVNETVIASFCWPVYFFSENYNNFILYEQNCIFIDIKDNIFLIIFLMLFIKKRS